jgi:hypothetical protein
MGLSVVFETVVPVYCSVGILRQFSYWLSRTLSWARGVCVFDGCGSSLIGDEVLDRDRRALGLTYTPEASKRGEEGNEGGNEVVLGISPCRPGGRDA